MTTYHIKSEAGLQGPFTLAQIRQIELTNTMLVKRTGGAWSSPESFAELKDYVVYIDALVQVENLDGLSYYYADSGQFYGPFTITELGSLGLNSKSHVAVGRPTRWFPVGNIIGLLDKLQAVYDKLMQEWEKANARPADVVDERQLQQLIDDCNRIDISAPGDTQEQRRLWMEQYCSYESLAEDILTKAQRLCQYNREKGIRTANAGNFLLQVKDLLDGRRLQMPSFVEQIFALADPSKRTWSELSRSNVKDEPYIRIGEIKKTYDVFDNTVLFHTPVFAPLMNARHLVVDYRDRDKQQALDIVNTVLSRLLLNYPSGLLKIHTVDADEMDGTSAAFFQLKPSIYQVYSSNRDIEGCLQEMVQHIEDVIHNVLTPTETTLYAVNQHRESQEPYRMLVIEDYPNGLSELSQDLLKRILRNGIRAGIMVILLRNTEMEQRMTNDSRRSQLCIEDLGCPLYSISVNDSSVDYDCVSEYKILDVVDYVNEGFNLAKKEIIQFADYVPDKDYWWTANSSSNALIPFGVGKSRQQVALRISQADAQNTVLVIGLPGSGKSVFLHTIIVNAAIHYSPEELQMYLLDFSGVEFNTYALHNFPHARVIGPEAEREFGLSVLQELKAEGERRMILCRENNVNNIVELRRVCPDQKVPRLLIIIDEFQKLFEIENDAISREATSIIHTIIQEYRKFGINLMLATQRLTGLSSVLPYHLIANRVVFKSTEQDFNTLINKSASAGEIQLGNGECIYNSQAGESRASKETKCFYLTDQEKEAYLEQMSRMTALREDVAVPETLVFRSDECPANFLFAREHEQPQELPESVGAYMGESIAISETHVYAELRHESGNNMLIVGGEKSVAEPLVLKVMDSFMAQHTDESAEFYFYNFMRRENPLNAPLREDIEAMSECFPIHECATEEDVLGSLGAVKSLIEERIQDSSLPQKHIYLAFITFEQGRMFEKGGRRGDDPSESGNLLRYILEKGPSVGVFVILQMDKLACFDRLDAKLQYFRHRIALQMTEGESNKILDSSMAMKLYQPSKPYSKYRAYYKDVQLNTVVKFKPYKINL